MSGNRKTMGAGVAAGVVGTLAVLAAIGLVTVYTGAYGVAATEEHSSIVRWGLDTNFHNAVENGAEDVEAPGEFTEAMLQDGAREYKEACQYCHAGPGVEAAEWASGMRPRPPHLADEAAEWEPAEIFWLAKHGVRMTGMPAFGPSHDDEELWAVAAFVKQLPAMSPETYAAYGREERAGEAGPAGG